MLSGGIDIGYTDPTSMIAEIAGGAQQLLWLLVENLRCASCWTRSFLKLPNNFLRVSVLAIFSIRTAED